MTFATPGEMRVTLNLKGGDRVSFLQVFGTGDIPRRESWGDARGFAMRWSGTLARNIGLPDFSCQALNYSNEAEALKRAMPKMRLFRSFRPARTDCRRAPRGSSLRASARPSLFRRNAETVRICEAGGRRARAPPCLRTWAHGLYGFRDGGIADRDRFACRAPLRGFVAEQGMNSVDGYRCVWPTVPSGFPNRRCEINFFTRTSAAPKNGPRLWAAALRNRRSPTLRSRDLPGAGFGRHRDGRRLGGRRMRT